MAINKVIIHAGLHKTGTTSIQRTLFQNKELMEANGYFIVDDFPVTNQGHVLVNLFAKNPPVNTRYNILRGIDEKKILENNKINNEILSNIINNTSSGILVLSGEPLSFTNPEYNISCIREYFSKNFGEIEVQVILCVRDPISMAVSFYQERLSALNPKTETDESFMVPFVEGVFINRLEEFIKVFEDKAHIYKFEDALQHPFGLTGYFLQEIGIPESEIPKFDFVRANESRCAEVLELLFEIQKVFPGMVKKNGKTIVGLSRKFGDTNCMLSIPGTKFDIPYEKKMKLRQFAEKDIFWLKQATGIDYTELPPEKAVSSPYYGPETIEGFINAFPELSLPLKMIFINFFMRKHLETGDDKFIPLYAESSIPYKIYKRSFDDMCSQFSKLKKQKANWEKQKGDINVQLQKLQKELNNQEKRYEELNARHTTLVNSRSWKITEPLRKMINFCMGKSGKDK